MVVKAGNLVHFYWSELHFMGEGNQVSRRQMAIAILDEMQMFDQEVPPARGIGQQGLDFSEGLGVNTTPFWPSTKAPWTFFTALPVVFHRFPYRTGALVKKA